MVVKIEWSSPVWKYLETTVELKKAWCNLCQSEMLLAYCGGTKILLCYLKNSTQLSARRAALVRLRAQDKPVWEPSSSVVKKVPTWMYTENHYTPRRGGCLLLRRDLHPLNSTERDGFRQMFEFIHTHTLPRCGISLWYTGPGAQGRAWFPWHIPQLALPSCDMYMYAN